MLMPFASTASPVESGDLSNLTFGPIGSHAMEDQSERRHRRSLTLLSLILAGEAIYVSPFHPGRYFKSSLLSTFGIDEYQHGQLGAIYGVLAMACYFLGGPVADRFSPRRLLPVSLVATGLGSLYMSTIPAFRGLCFLFGFWGVSTILAFWAPLIRATREWGGEEGQGRAFGLLDGGRGLVAASVAAIAAYAFGAMVRGNASADPARETAALQTLLYSYAACCFLAAVCVWFFVPDPKPVAARSADHREKELAGALRRLTLVLRSPAVWLQAVVIIAAYSTFKLFDIYGLYSEDAYGLTRTESPKIVAYLSFLRFGAPLAAGWIADRFLRISPSIQLCFGLLIATYGMFLFVPPSRDLVWLMIANMAVSCAAFFALRGIYFGLLEESGTPRELTGTAVGIICFVGFTPEIFMPLLTGWLIREARSSGNVLTGYDQIFWILILLSLIGLLAAAALRRLGSRTR
jgi:sugar phosphate permease